MSDKFGSLIALSLTVLFFFSTVSGKFGSLVALSLTVLFFFSTESDKFGSVVALSLTVLFFIFHPVRQVAGTHFPPIWHYVSGTHCACQTSRVGQNCIYTLYMAVYLVISLQKMLYMHRVYMVWANPTNK